MKQIKFYDFPLDGSAEQKWNHIIEDFKEYIPTLKNHLQSILNQFGVATTVIKPLYHMTSEDKIMFYDEICFLAGKIGLDPFEVLLMQLIYETSSACTAAVLNVNGKPMFFRTMD